MRTLQTSAVTLAAVLGLAAPGCADAESETPERAGTPPAAASTPAPTATASARRGTRIVVRGSRFGRMLFDGRRQAIYIFEKDARRRSNCHGACAEAWPPVYTRGRPQAGKGVRASLLGTIRRRDGRRQVTYAGRPLYFYAHEDPGQVLCHNVFLNGGLWWVVGPDGRRRP